MQQQVVGDKDLNEEQLFNQLFKARLGHPPYDKYEGWYDITLWEEIVKELGSRSLFHNPTITDVLKVVIKYYKEYKSGPELIQKCLSHSLRLNIYRVFSSFTDKFGSLTFDALETMHSIVRPQSSLSGEIIEYKNDAQALEELIKVCEEKARRILTSTSNRKGIREFRKETGFVGLMALQYGEDLTALGITDDEKIWLLQKFNSGSIEYMSLANQPLQTRLNFFRRILQDADITVHEPECSSHRSSTAKSSKRRKESRINS
ncbi:unnamed protein product [Vicia faba]|uniref:Uncharacterized protein n=1 Tax=Vicia faba TaxID=3906 RepID=A0AAV1BB30_VICFA|nr:unnamed protein product [Vicia faba]